LRTAPGRLGALAAGIGLAVALPDPGVPGGLLVMLTCLVLIYHKLVDGSLKPLGLGLPGNPRRLLGRALLATIVLLACGKLLLAPLIEHITGQPRDLSRFALFRDNPRAVLRMLVMIWVTAALCEEILFRGFILAMWKGAFGIGRRQDLCGALFSALLFGLAHFYQGLSGMLLTTALGFLLALLYVRNGRELYINILAHGFFDTTSLLLIFLRGAK
jgi:hypothetical protein